MFRLTVTILLLSATLAVAACGGGRSKPLYPTGYVMPMEAPPPPRRRPVIPTEFTSIPKGVDLVGETSVVARATAETIETGKIETATLESQPAPRSKPTVQEPAQAPLPQGRYRVKAGDTLYAVSRSTGLPIRTLIEANNLSAPYTLSVGDELLLPAPRVHVVRRSETVSGISRMHNVQMSELVRLNDIPPPYKIPVGARLVLPSSKTGAVSTAAVQSPKPQGTASAGGSAAQPAQTQSAAASATARSGAGVPKPPPRQGGRFLWPVQGKVIEKFGPQGSGRHNDGINILAPRGEPVRAAENGVVVYAGAQLQGFGQMLLIKHADSWLTAYAHNQDLAVKRGDTVKRGQTVARVGSTGNVAGPQLHFEVRKGKRAVNPMKVLEKSPNQPSG